MRTSIASGCLLLVAAFTLVGCQTDSVAGAPTAAPVPAVAQKAAPESTAPTEEAFVASGPIVVENQVEVLSQRDGLISELAADTGTSVRKGQLLAKLDDRQLQADRDAAAAQARSIQADLKNWEASVKVAESDVERANKMWDAQLITKEQLEHDRYKLVATKFEADRERENYARALAAQKSLELELEKTRILAPFGGVVGRRYVHNGQRVAKDEKLFWVTATAPMRVKFTLPENYIGKVGKGSLITVIPSALPGEKHSARVLMVSPVVDPASATIEVTAELTGNMGALKPGMIANIRLNK